jgi:hypothetical protein
MYDFLEQHFFGFAHGFFGKADWRRVFFDKQNKTPAGGDDEGSIVWFRKFAQSEASKAVFVLY